MLYNNMEYFIAIVEHGSLTRAAEQLYVSQPYLSQYLKRLEKNLGVELFNRNISPLQLTFSGERYYQHLLQVQKMNERMRKEFQDIQNQVSGILRLGVALWRGACLLPDVFPAFHQKYPDIHIELLEGRSNQLIAALMNNKIDLAVANIPHNLDYSKFVCDVIFNEQILLAAPTNHPAIQKILTDCDYNKGYPVAPIGILNEIPLVLTKPGQNLTIEINHALNRCGIEPDILMYTANLTTAINLCAKGISCAFVPEEGAKVCVHPGEVTYFSVSELNLSWDLAVLYKRDTYLNNITKLFIHELKETLKK